jgi:two-component system, NtrC family, response regulator AtoC
MEREMRVAVVDDESIVRTRLQTALTKQGYSVEVYGSGEDFLKNQQSIPFDLVFLDIKLPGIDGIEVLKKVKSGFSDTEVILITGYASIDSVVQSVKLGAFHYVAKPLKLDEVRHLAARALEHKHLLEENRELKTRLEPHEGSGGMIGISTRIKEIFGMISKVAPLDCNILIQGDSGTGKNWWPGQSIAKAEEKTALLWHLTARDLQKTSSRANSSGTSVELLRAPPLRK